MEKRRVESECKKEPAGHKERLSPRYFFFFLVFNDVISFSEWTILRVHE